MTTNNFSTILNSLVLILFISVPGKVRSSDLPAYVAGAYTKLIIHELGHASIAKWYGATDISIEIPRENAGIYSGATYYYDTSAESKTPEFRRTMSLAGLIAANLAGEIVINQDGLHDNAFAQGILSMAQFSNISHVFKYYTGLRYADGKGNDIDSYKEAGGNPHVLTATLLIYTAWSLKRMSDKSIPLFGFDVRF